MDVTYLAAKRLARTAFALRVVAVFVIHFFVEPGLFAPDELTYDQRGLRLANYWRGELAGAFRKQINLESLVRKR